MIRCEWLSACKTLQWLEAQCGTVSMSANHCTTWLTILAATSVAPTDTCPVSNPIDDLPPFATLLTDEDRERKAETSSPGTYHVVINPNSFQHMPEYSEDPEIKKERTSPLRRASLALSLASSIGRESIEGIPIPGDPNIVVLPRFEDLTRRPSGNSKDPRSSTSPILQHPKIKIEERLKPETPVVDANIEDAADASYLQHFRNVVWKQLVPADIDRSADDRPGASSVGILEAQAAYYPPVRSFHAGQAIPNIHSFSTPSWLLRL